MWIIFSGFLSRKCAHSYRWAVQMALHPAETRPDLRSAGPCDLTTDGRTRTSLWEEPKIIRNSHYRRIVQKRLSWADVSFRHLVSVCCRVCESNFPHTDDWVAAVWSAPESLAGSAHAAHWQSRGNTLETSWSSSSDKLIWKFGLVGHSSSVLLPCFPVQMSKDS